MNTTIMHVHVYKHCLLYMQAYRCTRTCITTHTGSSDSHTGSSEEEEEEEEEEEKEEEKQEEDL